MPSAAGRGFFGSGRIGVAAVVLPVLLAVGVAGPAGAWERRVCQDCDIPYQWEDPEDQPPAYDNPPLPQGFVLTYRVGHGLVPPPSRPLDRYVEVGNALAGCWASKAVAGDWREVTLRLSFRRDGSINGIPRIQHVEAPGDASVLADLRSSFLSTLDHCTPLRFSPSLGQAIAGQIFAIRFVQAKDDQHG